MRRLAFLVLALTLVSLACNAGPTAGSPPSPAPPSLAAASTTPSAPTDTPPPTSTSTPAATATPSPSPTPPPDLVIGLSTLSQVRQLWSLSAPGKPLDPTSLECQGPACDAWTRIGGYAFSPDSTRLAVGLCTGDVTLNRADNKHPFYTCAADGEVKVLDAATGSVAVDLTVGGFPLSLAFDPAGDRLAVGLANGQIEIWDLAASTRLQAFKHPSVYDGVASLAYTPDGSRLISMGDNKVVFWDPSGGTQIKAAEGRGTLSLDPSGQRAVSAWYDSASIRQVARIYDLTQPGRFKDIRLKFVQPNMFDTVFRAAFVNNGADILVWGPNGAEWWDTQGQAMKGHTDVEKLITDKNNAFAPMGAITPSGQIVTVPGIELPGVPLPLGGNLFGPPTCGFALWQPEVAGVSAVPLSNSGCSLGVLMGDGRRGVVSPDGHWIAADNGSGNLRVWGVDPTAPVVPTICLGECGGG